MSNRDKLGVVLVPSKLSRFVEIFPNLAFTQQYHLKKTLNRFRKLDKIRNGGAKAP